MKIGLLTDSDVFAGTERHMLDLALELRALGVAPSLICPSAGALAERARAAGLPVCGLEKRGAIDLKGAGILRGWLRDGVFDLLHAHNGRTALLGALARAGTRRGALVTTQHFLAPTQATRRGLAKIVGAIIHRFVDRHVDRVIAISQAVARASLARRDTAEEKIRVVLNGIRDPSAAALADSAQVRAQFGVAAEAPLIVCLARLDTEKGVDVLIDAMLQVRQAQPSARCVIAGRGALESDLRERIKAAGAEEIVRLVGFVEDSLSLVRAADLFVLPSLAEPFGLSIVEAMALQKAVISTATGGPLEIIRDGVTGRLVPPGEVAPLAAALTELVTDRITREAFGRAGRAEFEARFTAAQMAAEILAVYREILPA